MQRRSVQPYQEPPKKSRTGLIIGIIVAIVVVIIIVVIIILIIRSRSSCDIPAAPIGVTSLSSTTQADQIGYSFTLTSSEITSVLTKVTNGTSQTFTYTTTLPAILPAQIGQPKTITIPRASFTPPITGTPTTFQVALTSACGTSPYSAAVTY